ncbi:MAG: rod shape-determining protein [Candidatus Margulisbacteria bacterium]|nr:rod shape-determining protein [Candidatus Margulisiibacteriota bacterium]
MSKFRKDIGIDLGTANIVVYVKDRGIVLREPSVVAIDKNTRQFMAIGNEAKLMVGRTPGNIIAIRPLRDGVIVDFEISEQMIRTFIKKVYPKHYFMKPRVIIGVPSGITNVERRAVIEAGLQAGSKEVFLIEEPMAAAIGAGLPINEPNGHMIVDIGGGTTEVAVISLGGIVVSKSIRVAGDEMDEAIVNHCRTNYNLLIGERTAEAIKIQIGSAYPKPEEKEVEIKGRDLISGLPKTFTLSAAEIRHCLLEPVNTIVQTIKLALEQTPPELSSDILQKGIFLTGGGSLLFGLDKFITEETGVKTNIVDDPLSSVAYGTGKVMQDLDKHINKILFQ